MYSNRESNLYYVDLCGPIKWNTNAGSFVRHSFLAQKYNLEFLWWFYHEFQPSRHLPSGDKKKMFKDSSFSIAPISLFFLLSFHSFSVSLSGCVFFLKIGKTTIFFMSIEPRIALNYVRLNMNGEQKMPARIRDCLHNLRGCLFK